MNISVEQMSKEVIERLYNEGEINIEMVIQEVFNIINELSVFQFEQERLLNFQDSEFLN